MAKSPFPGMDPFLESPAFWSDFHSTFVHCWREAVADGLPDDYEANIDERVYLVETDPDVRKLINMPLEILDRPHEFFIEILQRPELSLVAVLELLSPANKENPGRAEYLGKRNAILRQNVHLVELDLLVGGQRVPAPRPLPPADCYYLVARAEQRFDCQVYRWSLTDPLPRLPVPLRPPHTDLIIDLAQVFSTAYERGRFGRRLRYDRPCPAPLSAAQRVWAEGAAAQVGRA